MNYRRIDSECRYFDYTLCPELNNFLQLYLAHILVLCDQCLRVIVKVCGHCLNSGFYSGLSSGTVLILKAQHD